MDLRNYALKGQKKIILETERIKLLLKKIGNPDKKMKIIHVAGTNGKGSVCAFLREGFMQMGYKIGGFSSPEMIDITDSITVNNVQVSMSTLEAIYDLISLSVNDVFNETGKMPSQFEINFASAMLYFERCGCNAAIIECGMGGIGDATNAISDSAVSVLTHIALDHCKFLGNNIEEITQNKCGIFKDKSVIVTGFQEKEAMNTIYKCAKGRRVITAKLPIPHGFCDMHEIFDYDEYRNLKCSLCGIHQIENAAIAIEVLRLFGATDEIIKKTISLTKNIGRFEQIAPNIYFEGAHNPNGFQRFIQNINRYKITGKIIFILGFMADKDIKSCVNYLDELDNRNFEIYTINIASNSRSATAQSLCSICADIGYTAKPFYDVNSAIKSAKKSADTVFIVGSLYTYKEIKIS